MHTPTRHTSSIRFPLVKERVKGAGRRGPRFRLVANTAGLVGSAACAANLINGALVYRAEAKRECADPVLVRIARLGMRLDALWARVFAGQINPHDPRLDAVMRERSELIERRTVRFTAA